MYTPENDSTLDATIQRRMIQLCAIWFWEIKHDNVIISYWAIFSVCGYNRFTASSNYTQKHVDNSNQSVGYGTMNIVCHPNIITEIITL